MARETLDHSVQHCLCLRVDPVEIFEHENDGLAAAVLEQQQLHRLQRPSPLLLRVELRPLRVGARDVEEREQGGEHRRQRSLERQHLLRDPLPNLVRVVARLDVEVRLQKVDDRQIGHPLPVGGRAAHKDQRISEAVRLDELPEKT